MLKERLMNPGSYFRFGWQRETERVVCVVLREDEEREGLFMWRITKGMLDKREP